MNIHDKHSAYSRLKTADESKIRADIALLQQKSPKNKALDFPSLNMERKEQEVLWELLDFATVEEIEAARMPKTAEEIKREQDLKFLSTEKAEVIAKDIAFLAEKAPESEALLLSDEELQLKGKKVLEALLDVVTADEIVVARFKVVENPPIVGTDEGGNTEKNTETSTTEQSSNPDAKKKANKTNTPT